MSGRVEAIQIHTRGRGEPLDRVERVRVEAGRGPEGDRHARRPKKGRHITLIEAEALDRLRDESGIDLAPEEAQRNVTTRGIDLNALDGKRFRVGDVECEGAELCHPCRHLERMTQPGVLKGLVNAGGLCANVLTSGEIAVGDPVEPC